MNVRLEKIEMSTVGQTFGPRPRINLELARKIAEDFDIRLEDYIKVESLD